MTTSKKIKFHEDIESKSGMHIKTCQHLSFTSLTTMKIKVWVPSIELVLEITGEITVHEFNV